MKSGNAHEDVESLILNLYRSASAVALDDFQDYALNELGAIIRFDAAWWGRAVFPTSRILSVHLMNAKPSILNDYQRVLDHDFFRDALLGEPGRTFSMLELISRDDLLRHPLYTLYGEQHLINDALGTVLYEQGSALCEFLTVWRFDARWPFSPRDREVMQGVVAHLFESFRISRLLSLQERVNADVSSTSARAWALVDADSGCIVEVSAAFVDLIRSEWPEWAGDLIPDVMLRSARRGPGVVAKAVHVRGHMVGEYLFVVARKASAVDHLGPREREAALHFAAGRSIDEVATLMGTSPATVRNQIGRVYRKLGVHSKIELINMLSDVDSDNDFPLQ